MNNIFFCLLITGIILTSCKKDNNTLPECNVEDPIEEFDWLKEVKNSFTNCSCWISILQGRYKGGTVYYTMITDPVCNSVFEVTLWDCNGNIVREYKTGENEIFGNEVELVRNLYTCTD
jgi:hypothetical protein